MTAGAMYPIGRWRNYLDQEAFSRSSIRYDEANRSSATVEPRLIVKLAQLDGLGGMVSDKLDMIAVQKARDRYEYARLAKRRSLRSASKQTVDSYVKRCDSFLEITTLSLDPFVIEARKSIAELRRRAADASANKARGRPRNENLSEFLRSLEPLYLAAGGRSVAVSRTYERKSPFCSFAWAVLQDLDPAVRGVCSENAIMVHWEKYRKK